MWRALHEEVSVLVQRETITTERVAQVVLLLMRHRREPLPTSVIANHVGMTTGGTWLMLTKISRVAPLHLTSDGWLLVVPD